ncbi:hypothetical protein CK203_113470 [Vitis vinifera]|uniref:Uncharacterized protein n=1 Tax=Vitis vinifera TaxID=29760 RepID=A0A438C8D9_VITVI|nr:hypothetical protein CK203_113470 [Vitis vinifera]
MAPEVIIKRPMVTQPPIEGNLDCRARPFHSELVLTERPSGFSQSSEIHSICYRVREPTVIHFTIDKCHGVLGARHIAKALHIPYEPIRPEDYRVWAHPSQSDMVHILSRGTSTMPIFVEEGAPSQHFLYRCTSAPQHLSTSTYGAEERSFTREEAVESRCHSTSIPEIIMSDLGALGYPSEPQLERRRICREIFTLDKWTSMTTYNVEPETLAAPEHPEEPRSVEIFADMRAPAPVVPSIGLIPEGPPLAEQIVPPEETTTGEIEASIPSIQTSTTEPSSPRDPPTTI